MSTLFISDLHLDGSRPEVTRQFLSFLKDEARNADALYILGDLFELWIGDDDTDPEKRLIVDALADLTRSSVHCYVLRGNRDFLLGERFSAESGCKLLEEGAVVDLYGKPVLLMHGDTLCTDDRSYQRLRRILHNRLVQFVLRNLSLARRNGLAAKIREGSKAHTTRTAPMIMDVNAGAVASAFADQRIDTLIHGHTHRPAIHKFEVAGRPVARIVLGDWYTQGSVLEWTRQGYELRSLRRS
ncbi:MAG: UDP-2,3-diacylglucosamine diphosphatase [Steroidobacteraceae bacterium]